MVGSNGGEGEALHGAQFIRRHGPGDALRITASVLYATVGVIETQAGRNNAVIASGCARAQAENDQKNAKSEKVEK